MKNTKTAKTAKKRGRHTEKRVTDVFGASGPYSEREGRIGRILTKAIAQAVKKTAPAALRAIATWSPAERKSLALILISVGTKIDKL